MAKNSQALALPDNVFSMLAEADKQRGFPPGTMQSLLMQETGGQAKYIADPTTYHYAANAEGKRIAGHTGKISTAYGPFGILESTAKDPGYGVKPMGDKADLAEHIRFAGDYLAARSKSGGGLSAGLAGYGEGEKYAAQVVGRRDGRVPATNLVAAAPVVVPQATPAPVMVAQAPVTEPVTAPVEQVVAQAPTPAATGPNSWDSFLANLRSAQAPQTVADAAVQQPVSKGVQVPNFMAALSGLNQQDPRVMLQAFGGFGGRV